MHAHAFFDASAQVGQFQRLRMLDGEGQLSLGIGLVNFCAEPLIYFSIFDHVVKDGSDGNCRGIRASQPWGRAEKDKSQWAQSSMETKQQDEYSQRDVCFLFDFSPGEIQLFALLSLDVE